MSGICGVWLFAGGNPGTQNMSTLLERRGPDGTNSWADGPVALGHTLLATTPEALTESLPLSDPVSGCTITADARLDNRNILISSLGLVSERRPIGDGELILRSYLLWGEECPKHLLGDFAFAIWDPRSNSLFCARDHMGMRQLIYSHKKGELFAFSTEADALVASGTVPKVLNDARIADFLDDLESVDVTSTFYQGVFRLPPAHVLLVNEREVTLSRYWELSPGQQINLPSDEAYAKAFEEVFTEAVRCRLRSSGGIGSMLSGGLDSNSAAAVAAKLFTEDGRGRFPVFSAIATGLQDCIETKCIQAALQNDKFFPVLIDLSNPEPYLTRLLELDRAVAEPFDAQMTMVRAVYLTAHRNGIKSLFDGLSGDLVLTAGNSVARFLKRGRLKRAWREAKSREAFWGGSETAQRMMLAAAWSAFVPTWFRALRRAIISWRADFALNMGRQLMSRRFARSVGLKARRLRHRRLDGKFASLTPADRASVISHPALVNGRERYDRVASALAIEPRDPFLDVRLIEFCLALPPAQLEYRGFPKIILRRAMSGLIPDEIAWRAGKSHLGLSFSKMLAAARDDLGNKGNFPWDLMSRYLSPTVVRGREFASTMDFRTYSKLMALGSWLGRQAKLVLPGGKNSMDNRSRRASSKSMTYAAPKLTCFGEVSKLTAIGTKSGNENQGNVQGRN